MLPKPPPHPPAPLTVVWPVATKWRYTHKRQPPSTPVLKVVKPLRTAEHIIGQW